MVVRVLQFDVGHVGLVDVVHVVVVAAVPPLVLVVVTLGRAVAETIIMDQK